MCTYHDGSSQGTLGSVGSGAVPCTVALCHYFIVSFISNHRRLRQTFYMYFIIFKNKCARANTDGDIITRREHAASYCTDTRPAFNPLCRPTISTVTCCVTARCWSPAACVYTGSTGNNNAVKCASQQAESVRKAFAVSLLYGRRLHELRRIPRRGGPAPAKWTALSAWQAPVVGRRRKHDMSPPIRPSDARKDGFVNIRFYEQTGGR